jgi:hypothetical protein
MSNTVPPNETADEALARLDEEDRLRESFSSFVTDQNAGTALVAADARNDQFVKEWFANREAYLYRDVDLRSFVSLRRIDEGFDSHEWPSKVKTSV